MGVLPCISSFCVFYGTALGVRHQGLNPSSNPFPESLDPALAAQSHQALHISSNHSVRSVNFVLVFGSKLVSYDAAGLPPGMVSEPRRRLEPTLAGSLVVFGCENEHGASLDIFCLQERG